MSLALVILAALTALYYRTRGKTSQALVGNQEATKELNKVDESVAKNDGELESQEETRKTNEVPNVDTQDLVDFVNKRLPPT